MTARVQANPYEVAVASLPESTEPAWCIALLFPPQGAWNDEDYLGLDTNRIVELCQGEIEVLPMPSDRHQAILVFLSVLVSAYACQVGGIVRLAPLPLRLGSKHYREPDLLFLQSSTDPRRSRTYWTGADLVIEVVSPDDPDRDLVHKRDEYAQAGIPEYLDRQSVKPGDPGAEIVRFRVPGARSF